MKTTCLGGLFVGGLLSLATAAQAAPLLAVDFGPTNTTTNSPLQSGFQLFDTSLVTVNFNGPVSKTYSGLDATQTSGTVKLTINGTTDLTTPGALTTRDRTDSTTLANSNYANLYRDFVTAGTYMTIGFSGLNANTNYSATFYSFDNDRSQTQTFADYTNGSAGVSGAITYAASYAFTTTTPDNVFATTLTAKSDANGNLVFRETANANGAVLNGLTLSVPEPASLGLLIGGLMLLGRRKR